MPDDTTRAATGTRAIRIRGARQNNLKNLDLDLPTGELIVVTGVSGSGKSSLVFDTLYAEGQRRYVETFSPYARQFLDRMDRPQVDSITGVPPAIAIDQTNPVRTSRSTVGTMTELNDHLKLLFARAGRLFCRGCGRPVKRDSAGSIYDELASRCAGQDDCRLTITFPVKVPKNFSEAEIRAHLEAQGYTRFVDPPSPEGQGERGTLNVSQDRFSFDKVDRQRVIEALEAALRVGSGRVDVRKMEADPGSGSGAGSIFRFSTDLHCATCDIHYADPHPSSFSFNSPLGACETCRGFGRVIGLDLGLVIPDENKTLAGGAVRPWQTKSFVECQRDMEKYAQKFSIPLDVPWDRMNDEHRRWVIEGQKGWTGKWQSQWYGIKRFFHWLESKSYKMHIRVLLSKYRAYTPCDACSGSRLKPDALLWKVGTPGLSIHQLMLLPLERVRQFFDELSFDGVLDAATELLLDEVRARLRFLNDVGVGYLTLDRQSRTLSGGEVQRINLTTALGTSLVNTLFVLDEPSIGLHPRDMYRVVDVMHRLRSAGNSLVVVEHDPAVMLAADRLIDLGPGPGERGGEIVFTGTPDEIKRAATLTGQYLSGRKQVELPGLTPDGYATRNVRPNAPRLVLEGAREHNLKNVSVELPLNHLVVVTGVSGSGKSTLVQDVLYPALAKAKGKSVETPGAHDRLLGHDWVAGVSLVDQSPIGKTTRSNPASYVGAFDAIRQLFAKTPLAKERDYGPGMFSFNTGNGRCPTCGGNGFEHIEMQFLSDVYLRCPDCNGKRFRPEVLEVKLERPRGALSIADVLGLTVNEALTFFGAEAEVVRGLQPLADVGLDYVKLGQPVPTLSGGEAQRLKIAGFLAEAARKPAGAGRSTTLSPAPLPLGEGSRLSPRASLLLFDEPTTGLHFDDVAKLMRALRKLLAAGHSLIVIEHNLDVIRAADWIVDLGPEGGDAGGEIVIAGTPRDVMAHENSHTGRALREYEKQIAREPRLAGNDYPTPLPEEPRACRRASLRRREACASRNPASAPLKGEERNQNISIRHAREHNLKGVDVDIPRDTFTVITGVSGSGKSTLAFDILFNEGQRRYLESLNAYARSIVQPAGKPDVDAIFGIPPTVAIEQRASRGGRKSTVATMTEVYHFLRLLYVKLGTQYCPDCNVPVTPQSFEAIAAQLLRDFVGEHIGLLAPLVVNRKGLYTDLAKWARKKGHTHLRVDGEFIPTAKWPRLDRFKEHTLELPVGDMVVAKDNEAALRASLKSALEHGHGVVHVAWPLERLNNLEQRVFSTKRACPSCGTSFPEPDPRLFSYNSKHGWCPDCFGTGLQLHGFDAEQSGEEIQWNAWFEGEAAACETCRGARLNRTALAVRWQDRSIAGLAALSVSDAKREFSRLALSGREADIARDVVSEVRSRLDFLEEVGLGYLALERAAPTLSGGEAQRIRLAAQLGSNLQGVCYVLDEPTIGLHPRDNRVLLNALGKLEAKGNTLVVVEHDEDTIRRAQHVIDIGPGAGSRGGQVVAYGSLADVIGNDASITGRYLREPLAHASEPRREVNDGTLRIEIKGARQFNLQSIDTSFPLVRLTVVTGVSGSGKSTLARDVLLSNLAAAVGRHSRPPPRAGGEGGDSQRASVAPPERRALASARLRQGWWQGQDESHTWKGCDSIDGWQNVDRVLEVDQTPIGKTPRSCPATYVGFWDSIRRLFADTFEARTRGYTASRFSFNSGDGRCHGCEGQGVRTIEMSFLPDVKVLCDVCNGARFNRETLDVLLRGKSAGEVLAMEVDAAVEFFGAHPSIARPLQLLQDVGLGYLTLGQPSPTLSGGEAQRIKLVTELAKAGNKFVPRSRDRSTSSVNTLYVLDEPTVGLAMADVEKLLRVLHRLVDAGNTVIVIEHNLDVIAEADWIIDLGPEGGADGGKVVATGAPRDVSWRATHTGKALREFLAGRRNG